MSDLPGYDAWKTRAPEAPEGEECEECGGEGVLHLYGERDFDEPSIHEPCERCDGTGYVDPPTPQEIKERKEEIDADRRLSE